MKYPLLVCAAGMIAVAGFALAAENKTPNTFGTSPDLPKPEKSLVPTVNIAKAIGWPDGKTPVAAKGLKVNEFSGDLDHPRWIYVLPNGDVLVAESDHPPKGEQGIVGWVRGKVMQRAGSAGKSADRITLLRDTDKDGVADERHAFLENLFSPFGMELIGDKFYVANADSIVVFPYKDGQTKIDYPGDKLTDLPGGPLNHHWTKNIIANEDGTKLYAAVGSNSNVGENGMENETNRAAILEVDVKTGDKRLYASGLRNPVGMDWNPETGELWTVVNERDELGDDLVPDYLTSVKEGGFYGWPYSYFGQNIDERPEPKRPDLVAKAIVPDYALGAHTASLGMVFYDENALGEKYTGGVFIGQHGSWNRSEFSGYKVVFVPFKNGKPDGMPQDILTGFLSAEGEAMGRPVGVAADHNGNLLVADDVGDNIWRVSLSR